MDVVLACLLQFTVVAPSMRSSRMPSDTHRKKAVRATTQKRAGARRDGGASASSANSACLGKLTRSGTRAWRLSARRRAARRPCCSASAMQDAVVEQQRASPAPRGHDGRPQGFLDARQEHLLRQISRKKMAPGFYLRAAASRVTSTSGTKMFSTCAGLCSVGDK